MVMLHVATLMQQKYPLVYNVISSYTYVDNDGVFENSKEQVTEMANRMIPYLQETGFNTDYYPRLIETKR